MEKEVETKSGVDAVVATDVNVELKTNVITETNDSKDQNETNDKTSEKKNTESNDDVDNNKKEEENHNLNITQYDEIEDAKEEKKEKITADQCRSQDEKKKKGFLESLFSCTPKKKKTKVTVKIDIAKKIFENNITAENKFIKGVLFNIKSKEIYATYPVNFKFNGQEIEDIIGKTEQFKFDGENFSRKNDIFGVSIENKETTVGVKFNSTFLLIATWNTESNADFFLTCYNDILNNELKC